MVCRGALAAALAATVVAVPGAPQVATAAAAGVLPAGAVVRVNVPEAVGGKTVIGQLAVDGVTTAGWAAAYPCDEGLPRAADGQALRADLTYDGRVASAWSNRLIVEADDDGDVCVTSLRPAAIIVDVNGVTFDTGISSFANRRTDTRATDTPILPAGQELRIQVPEAVGGRTVVGNLAVDRTTGAGFVTAYGCADGIPRDSTGVARADLNFDGRVTSVWSNRLVVQADAAGMVCLVASKPASLIVDVNGVSQVGLFSFDNRRTDTRTSAPPVLPAGGVLRIPVAESIGGETVIGQVAVDRVTQGGFVTAYPCDAGLPVASDGTVSRADLNFDGRATSTWSNRLVVAADADGEVCLRTSVAAALVVDVNGVSDVGIFSFPNRRTDTRRGDVQVEGGGGGVDGVPVWPVYVTRPALVGVAALTGRPADAATAARPIVAVKIDNYRLARPPWGLELADAVIEENVEGVSRFVALFQTFQPTDVGPVRSARTQDIDLLAAMNRPVFAYSGANPGVSAWLASASASGMVADWSAQRNPCYRRATEKPGPHNLVLDVACAAQRAAGAGAASALWPIDGTWSAAGVSGTSADASFPVPMDGVAVEWTWDAASRSYLRSQDGEAHVTMSGARIAAANVVVLAVAYRPSPVDARSPAAVSVGTGSGVVHRDGVTIPIVWSRPTEFDAFELRHAVTGQVIPLQVGTTFVELTRAS